MPIFHAYERGSVGGKNGCELWTKSQDMAWCSSLCLTVANLGE